VVEYGSLKGRTIQDFLAWAFELLHQSKASRHEIMPLKLVFDKALETIYHFVMIKIMIHMGFDDKWIEIIFFMGKSVLLLNCVSLGQFNHKRDVTQGYRISLLFFWVVMLK
jgi:hypothetical protein